MVDQVELRGGYRTERYDKISTRILCSGGWVVAMIEQLSNGRWVISVGDQRYTARTFGSVKSAFVWWKEHHRTPTTPERSDD